MLKSKSIISEVNRISDGLRISVMSRHTLNDGITPDTRITDNSYDLWRPELGPPDKLIGDYYKRHKPWADFADEYLNYLDQQKLTFVLEQLVDFSYSENVTVLCIEDAADFCHRSLLIQKCLTLNPDLEYQID